MLSQSKKFEILAMFGHNIVIKTCVWALKLIFEILRSTVFKNLSRKMN